MGCQGRQGRAQAEQQRTQGGTHSVGSSRLARVGQSGDQRGTGARGVLPPHGPPMGREVLECASPLALCLGQSGRFESARGLAQSKTLARGRWFMSSKREHAVEGILTPALARSHGKRECIPALLDRSLVSDQFHTLADVFPLPFLKGEGRGEGSFPLQLPFNPGR